MYLNNFSSIKRNKTSYKRVGRGIGSGLGKTCGRGHKGQKSRSGGGVRRGFEGGQMPLYRRLPKFGFISKKNIITAEIYLSELNKVIDNKINLQTLKNANIISMKIKYAKIISSGTITRSFIIQGVRLTKGARIAIKAAGGQIEE